MRNTIVIGLLLSFFLSGCGGIRTFSTQTLAGSTVAVPAGWAQDFTRDNISITVTDSASTVFNIPIGDAAIRAVTNMYPDPVSSLVVDYRIDDPSNFGDTINTNQTAEDDDWWQTIVVFDTPAGMANGTADVTVNGPTGSYGPVDLDVIGTGGTPDPLQASFAFGDVTLTPGFLDPMDRPAHFTVNFSGGTIPYAIEVNFSHDPDSTVGGTGTALAINPRGDNTSMVWNDDGNNMKVIIMRANDLVIDHIKDFKFYVAGGITNLSLGTVTAYDANGAVVAGVSASCTGCI